jgi:hypothetical protein
MIEGYVRLHRRLLEWEWFGDSTTVHVLMFILLRANWQKKVWQGHVIEPGQLITSRLSIADSCGLTEKQVRGALDKLKGAGVITTDRAGLGQRISLQNWAEYQATGSEEGRTRAGVGAEQGPLSGPDEGRSRAVNEEGKNQKKGRRKEEKNSLTVEERLSAFRTRCLEIHQSEKILSNEEAKKFFDYWTEKNPTGRKMLFEMQKTFDPKLRMITWAGRVRPATTPRNGKQPRPTETELLLADIQAGKYDSPGEDQLPWPAGTTAHGAPQGAGDADLFERP